MNTASTTNGKASTTRTTFSRETKVQTEIKADPSVIWALLTNAADYPRWNPTVLSIQGDIALGSSIKLVSSLDPKRTFTLRVKELEKDRKLVWGDGQGQRTFTLSKNANGTTLFSMQERIGGLMFPLYARFIPPFNDSFEQFADSLRKEAEGIMKSPSA